MAIRPTGMVTFLFTDVELDVDDAESRELAVAKLEQVHRFVDVAERVQRRRPRHGRMRRRMSRPPW